MTDNQAVMTDNQDVTKEKKPRAEQYGLSPKETAFLQAYISGETKGNAMQSAAVAGYSDPQGNASKVLSRLKRHPEFIKALELAGLSTFGVAKATADALHAKYIHSNKEGVVETDIPDHRTRLFAARLGAEVLDMLPDRQQGKTLELGNNLTGLLEKAFEAIGKLKAVEAEYSVSDEKIEPKPSFRQDSSEK